MAESVEVMDVVLKEKLDSYGYDKMKNLKAPAELMVEITLDEYRELITKVATSDARIKEADSNKYERESENKALKAQVAELKQRNEALVVELHKERAKHESPKDPENE